MLTPEEVVLLREELATSKNPLFFYDDDPDGLCSFILLYKMHREGHGTIVKVAPKLDASFVRRVEEYHPDKIFILDMPIVEQEFVDKVKQPIFWIDHHSPLQLPGVHYFNPCIKDPNAYIPTTRMAYQVSSNTEDLWIAAVGCLADWHMPDFIDQVIEKYPYLLSQKMDLADVVFTQPMGKLIRIFSFILKGPTSEVNKCVKILTRIKSPEEILEQKTSQARFLYKHYEKVNIHYVPLLEEAKKKAGKSKLLLFYYTDQKWSFTSELSNELSTLYPHKIILIARKKSGEMKCSIRSQTTVLKALEKALVGIDGYGGGHPQACGAVVKEHDWEMFLKRFKEETK
ncbi:DHH family phosphoesterase [Candidatus Woesearchaeota archaeon]|nr:DHH family phosphoesterase [Candidatus Woesearchaeota archaeon]